MEEQNQRRLTPATLVAYLFGNEAAIRAIASNRSSVWIGIALVLSAGIARSYDQHDLVHEPWHALLGFPVAIVMSLVLYGVVYGIGRARRASLPPFGDGYARFLGLFMWIAPLAWMYAVPYERMLSSYEAVRLNLITLAVIAIWRVLLITRVLAVLFAIPAVLVFWPVMLIADVAAFSAMIFAPVPVVDLMGGLNYSPEDALRAGVAFNVQILSVVTAPIWFLGAIVFASRARPEWALQPHADAATVARSMRLLAAIAIGCASLALLWTQPQQMRRLRIEAMLKNGQVSDALHEMSLYTQEDFPRYWDPPPRVGYRDRSPASDALAASIEATDPASWVVELFIAKINSGLQSELLHFARDWSQAMPFVKSLGKDRVREHENTIRLLVRHSDSLSENDAAGLSELLNWLAEPEVAAGASPSNSNVSEPSNRHPARP